jgi:outer membrane protein
MIIGIFGLVATAQEPEASVEVPIKLETPEESRAIALRGRPASYLTRSGVQQAQPVSITLRDAIRRAIENNNEIEISRDDVRFQETQIRSQQGAYDPVFSVTPTFSRNSTTGSEATNDFRVNSSFGKFLERGGGNYQFFFNNTRTENQFAQAQVTSGSLGGGNSAIYSSQWGVNYNQPLARNRRTDFRRTQIAIAKKRLDQTDSDFRQTATETITQVQRVYWDLVFTLRNQQNQVANVNLARENLKLIEAKIDAGAAAPLERAEVATELASREGELLLATQQVSIAENALKQIIIKDPLSPEWSQTFMPTDAPRFDADAVSLDDAMRDAMENRFELKRLKLQRDINLLDIEYLKDQTKPQIDLNTTFSLGGLARSGTNSPLTTNLLTSSPDIFLLNSLNSTRATLGLPLITNPSLSIPPSPSFLFGGFGRSLANTFRTDAPNFSVGVTFSFPLRNRTAKADLEGARIQQRQLDKRTRSVEQSVIADVRNAVQAVETTRQRVLTARRARVNAEIQLEGERRLYEAGRSTSFLLFQRENVLTNSRNAEIRAETDYNKALADLQRVTSTAFRVNNITIESPLDGQ